MTSKKMGQQTIRFSVPPTILSWGNVVGKKEGEGPIGTCFDFVDFDDTFGAKSWEKAESTMQKQAINLALQRGKKELKDIDFLYAGDLINQCVPSSFAARDHKRPFFGLYGACSTMGEGMALASMAIDGGFSHLTAAVASSHFCTAERQYRTPLEYGAQRPQSAQWTVTGAGAVLLSDKGSGPYITHATIGKIMDKGICDTNNMGAAMAPAAYDTIRAHFADTGRTATDYDLIVTGDLGHIGREILLELFRKNGTTIEENHTDCGCVMFDPGKQDTHAGGSGCGCCASVFTGYFLNGMEKGQWDRILFCPTGALHSPVTAQQGESIPAICHALSISRTKDEKTGG